MKERVTYGYEFTIVSMEPSHQKFETIIRARLSLKSDFYTVEYGTFRLQIVLSHSKQEDAAVFLPTGCFYIVSFTRGIRGRGHRALFCVENSLYPKLGKSIFEQCSGAKFGKTSSPTPCTPQTNPLHQPPDYHPPPCANLHVQPLISAAIGGTTNQQLPCFVSCSRQTHQTRR